MNDLDLPDWAGVISGLAAAVALVLTLVQNVREARRQPREQAEKIIAWAVYEAGESGSESEHGGVIIINGSIDVALDVDVKTCASKDDGSLSPDGVPGQRFALIPPGTYYLPQRDDAWDAPLPVDTSGGKFVATIMDAEADSPVAINLVPLTRRPTPKRVAFLRYQVAGATWHRNAQSRLTRSPGVSTWDAEFTASERRNLPTLAVRPHQANDAVQGLMTMVFQRIAVVGSASDPGSRAKVKDEFEASGIRLIGRTSRHGQGVYLFLDDDPQGSCLYVSGDNRGLVPNAGIQFIARAGVNGTTKNVPQPVKRDASAWVEDLDSLVDAISDAARSRLPNHTR